jgi:hypothetical protein
VAPGQDRSVPILAAERAVETLASTASNTSTWSKTSSGPAGPPLAVLAPLPLVILAGLGMLAIPESTVRVGGRVNLGCAVLLSAWLVTLLTAITEAPAWGGCPPRSGRPGWVLAAVLTGAAAFTLLAVARDQVWQILLATVMIGAAVGLTFSAMPNVIVESVPPPSRPVWRPG